MAAWWRCAQPAESWRRSTSQRSPTSSYRNATTQGEIHYIVNLRTNCGIPLRFFPLDNNKYKNGNALAGTVVDQGINHPTEGDFYLLRLVKLCFVLFLFAFSTATRVSKGHHDPATTMSCGMTATSALTSWRSSHTTSATSTHGAPGNTIIVLIVVMQ